MTDLDEAVSGLRKEWNLDFIRVRRVLSRLADPATVAELVAASGLARRDVEAVLHALSSFTRTDGSRSRLPGLGRSDGSSARRDPAGGRLDEAVLAARMGDLAAGLPPSRWGLDHVPATSETMARRALYLAAEYELAGASVLCLGDHDLTSLAVGSVEPGADLTVVDIDDRILDHVTASAGTLALPLTAAWADLRLALPPSLVGTADLVFTDPPYTVDGMRLFLTRALEALRPTGHERLAFCFGTGERHLVKALEVQSLLGELRLALEAMLPGFNRYDGAEAIGARSDLYICRPTTGARVGEPAVSGRAGRAARSGGRVRSARVRPSAGSDAGSRIYTRGPASEEAHARSVPDAVVTAALTAAGDGPLLLVGEGWPDPAGPEEPALLAGAGREARRVGLPEFFGRVAAWVTAARPGPFPFTGTPVINTHPDYGAAALRTLLLAVPERAVLIGPRRELLAVGLLPGAPTARRSDERPAGPAPANRACEPDAPARLLGVAFDLVAVPAGPGGDPAVVAAVRHGRAPGGDAEAVIRHMVLHPGAKLVNAWRDGLVHAARERGTTLTRNEARARIDADGLTPALRRLRLWELPLAAVGELVTQVARSTGS
jgi:hypothetical protein